MACTAPYAEVVKDALRLHMDNETNSKKMAAISAAIAEGEADIKAGRVRPYSRKLMERLTEEALSSEDAWLHGRMNFTKRLQ